jgi:putative ABC transport system permease protein
MASLQAPTLPGRRKGSSLTFPSLVFINVGAKKLRLAFTALAIAIGVVAVVSLAVLTKGLETSDFAIMQMGKADFTISQKGVNDVLSSSIQESVVEEIAAQRGVAAATGVLVNMFRLNAANPVFLEIGLRPQDQAEFGVTIVSGRSYTPSATNEVMLGWRAANNLHLAVGSTLHIENADFRVVGLFSTGQALGDAGAMFPLSTLQAIERQSGQVSLVFVRAKPSTDVPALQSRIDREFPQLVTVRTIAQFGRADRSLTLIRTAEQGSIVLAVMIGAVVVMSAMSMTFVERFREFGLLSAIGWARSRIWAMILAEAVLMGLVGATFGSGLSALVIWAIGHFSSLGGVIELNFTADSFARALYTAAAMSLLGGIWPAWRAAHAEPLEALRHE